MAFDPSMVDVQELLTQLEECRAGAAAASHVNHHLNVEMEKCVRAWQAAKAEAESYKNLYHKAAKELAATKKENRILKEGKAGNLPDEPSAICDMLDRLEAKGGRPADTDLAPASPEEYNPTEGQVKLVSRLKRKGIAAGWLIDASEIQMGAMLGKGEFGVTYKATWRGTTVAVKHVRVKNEQELISFCRELEVLSGVRHPHVLPFLGAHFKDPDEFWLVTEYMEGGTLASWLHPKKHQKQTQIHGTSDTQPKAFLERVRMALEVANGLYALESLDPPVIHRDVKPSNILVDGAGHARIGDFGLARRLLPETVAELTGETGTYVYMAPEVMRHEIYDSKADVWGWGVLFVEAITLMAPYAFTYMTPEQIALAVADEQLMPVIPDDIDTDLQAIAKLALAFSPEERPGFGLITSELSRTYQRLLNQSQSSPTAQPLLTSVSRQLTNSWSSLLKRLYSSNLLSSAAAANAVAAHSPNS